MQDKYQKFIINMRLENEDFRLWKNGIEETVCILETYKEKRSIYFSVSNLLPSETLYAQDGLFYHVLLLGTDQGKIIHKDFGEFRVNQSGEGSFFQKFSGVPISCYTHCLLTASGPAAEQMVIIYQGVTPFFSAATERDAWRDVVSACNERRKTEVFSKGVDETRACWYRIDVKSPLPDVLRFASAQIEQYSHYIIGRKDATYYIGIPGRFLQREQPCREERLFLLWQPLCGGEHFFASPEEMNIQQQERIFGYWIAELDLENGRLKSL